MSYYYIILCYVKFPFQYVGNRRFMAALDAGCARTTMPHWYAYALVNNAQAMNIAFTPLSVSICFLSVLSLSSPFLFPLHFFLKFFLPSTNIINYDLHLRRIQTFCFHLSCSTPLRKTRTVNHYLRIKYFQHNSKKYTSDYR